MTKNKQIENSLNTSGAETFVNFANFVQIHESLRRKKFYIDRFVKIYVCKIFQFFFVQLVVCYYTCP